MNEPANRPKIYLPYCTYAMGEGYEKVMDKNGFRVGWGGVGGIASCVSWFSHDHKGQEDNVGPTRGRREH